jgi:hypothetical protein
MAVRDDQGMVADTSGADVVRTATTTRDPRVCMLLTIFNLAMTVDSMFRQAEVDGEATAGRRSKPCEGQRRRM